MIYLKLKCGSEILDLTDRVNTYPIDEVLKDDGEMVTVNIYARKSDLESQAIMALLHKLDWFNLRAVEYEQSHVGQPVMLGMKLYDGNLYDTLFGRGWMWKRLTGWHSVTEPALTYTLGADWYYEAEEGRLRTLALTMRTAPVDGYHGAKVFCWEPEGERWVGQARGAIRQTADGGLNLEEGTTGEAINGDFENEADTDNGWTAEAGLTATENSDPRYVYNGFFSMILVCGAADKTFTRSWTGSVSTWAIQCRAARLDFGVLSSTFAVLTYNGVDLTTTFTADPDRAGWYILTATFTGIASAKTIGIKVLANKTIVVDCFQWENKAYSTSYAYGNMGRGFTFSGADHLSTVVRAAAAIYYRNAFGVANMVLPRDVATVLVRWKPPRANTALGFDMYLFDCGNMELFYDNANARFSFSDGTNTITAACTFAAGDSLYVFARYGPSGVALYAYKRTASGSTPTCTLLASSTSASYAAPAPNASFFLGSDASAAKQAGEIQECQVWNAELTAAQVAARVDAGAGSPELPYLWSPQGGGEIYNHTDTDANHQAWIELGNAPGDEDAGLRLLIKNTAAVTPEFLYAGMMRRAVPASDLPSKRNLVGNHWKPWLEAEAGVASYDGNTADNADANGASGGKYALTTPNTTTNVKRINIPVANEPELLWPFLGKWRLVPLTKCNVATNFQVQFRVVLGMHLGELTAQVYADADNVRRPVVPTDQIVDIPTHFIDPKHLQELRPGDWAVGVEGVYCYIEYYVQATSIAGTPTFALDGLLLLPQDNEGWAQTARTTSWPQNSYLVLTGMGGIDAYFADDLDWERPRDTANWEGHHFTLPIRVPVRMVFLSRESGTGYPAIVADTMTVNARYKPRYRRAA